MNECMEVATGTLTGARKEREDTRASENADNIRPNEQTSIRPRRPRNPLRTQNFILVWLDSSIAEVNDNNYRSVITEFQRMVNSVNTFTDVDECVNFITDLNEENILLILSEAYVGTTVPIIHELLQVSSIYVFPGNKTYYEQWAKQWAKLEDVFADITSMSEEIRKVTQECDQNSVSISFIPSSYETTKENLDALDQSFMYTQILKEILLTIHFEQQHINEFLMYCREQFADNTIELKNADKLKQEYRVHQPIWWYTYECFLYSLINRALRLMDMDLIIKIGFFVRDLHQHIAALHSEQYSDCNHSHSFTVYRGQGLSCTDFNQLKSTQGGLLAFNNFLSTSQNRDVSLDFARRTMATSNLVGVLFILKIDPSISTTPFANVENVSCYQGEKEILFSMNSVFRIGQVKQIDGNDRLWQVDLTLTTDTDSQLYALTEYIRRESFPHQNGWYRLGSLLIKVAQFNKAEEVFITMLEQTCDESEKANIYHMLGIVKYNHGNYVEAITFYEKSIEIMQKIFSATHPDLAASYRNLGTVYDKMGEYSKALSFHEKALEIYQNTVSSNHFTFSASGDNSDLMDDAADDLTNAIWSLEKALKSLEQTLSTDDLSLVTFYERYGSVYKKMGDNQKALSYYERARKIKEKHLLSNHPSLAASYANLGAVYENMGDSSTAHSFYQRALDIGQRSLPANHPDLQVYRQNLRNKGQES